MANDGPSLSFRDWLISHREELNARYRAVARRRPGLEPGLMLHLCRELLPPLAVEPHLNLSALLHRVYDLILLHAGRGLLGNDSRNSTAVDALLRVAFPALRTHLLEQPQALPASLSNATENLRMQGAVFVQTVTTLGAEVASAKELLDVGEILAWRLGESRLRRRALAKAASLQPSAVLLALGIPGWPTVAVPILLAAMNADGWRTPAELISDQTLDRLASSPTLETVESLVAVITTTSNEPRKSWTLAGRAGNFRGFEGDFESPPLLLDQGPMPNRHCFWVRDGGNVYRVHADAFGWVCRPDPSIEAKPAMSSRPAGATSAVNGADFMAFTRRDSFRIRIFTPPRKPL